jgi:hypothetical protein
MNENLKIEKLDISQIRYLIDGFKKWYTKNNSEIDESQLLSISKDMYESDDTEIFCLKESDKPVGVFYIVTSNEHIEISGGMIEFSTSLNNTYFVFDFCRKEALQKNIFTMKIRVINKHYKYEALIKLYSRYGFKVEGIDDNGVSLLLNFAIR